MVISIHAPPRGATRLLVHHVQPPHFNSRPSARGDQRLAKVAFGAVISIHAPPRGATPLCLSENTTMDNFNSRPSARGDVMPDRRARWK